MPWAGVTSGLHSHRMNDLDQLRTPEEAYSAACSSSNVPQGKGSTFVCPHCHALSQQLWGRIGDVYSVQGSTRYSRTLSPTSPPVVFAECQACKQESVFSRGLLVVPRTVSAPIATPDMPPEIVDDYNEAREIASDSPRGAAALLRLAIQKLCPILGSTKSDINASIGELVAAGKITPMIQQALDSVRVIGNEAVHPGTVDLNDSPEVARALFNLVNFIIEKAITEPKQIDALYQSLPANKLAGIVQRDAPKP